MTLVLLLRVGIIPAQAAHYIHPVENLVLQACADHVAAAVVGAYHALCHPVRILHAQCVAEVPVLHINASRLVVDFECADGIEALTAWEQVDGCQRVEVLALSRQVRIVLLDVVEAEVEGHPVVQERCRIAERKVVTVVFVVGDDASCVRRTQGDVGLVLVGTGSQRHVVLYVRTGVEEVLGVIVPIG